MVEGPGATRNAQKASKAIGFRVSKVSTLPDSSSTKKDDGKPTTSNVLTGKVLVDAFSVGKECFLLFDSTMDMYEKTIENIHLYVESSATTTSSTTISSNNNNYNGTSALRFHFGMNGSLHISYGDEDSDDHQHHYRNKYRSLSTKKPSIYIEFYQSISNRKLHLKCYQTTISTCTGRVAVSKRTRLQHLDCCARDERFSLNDVILALQSRSDAMICDAILDQSKFPGVGNIIKIEGLHHSRVNPKTHVDNLSYHQLSSIVQECRNYAMDWLKSGRAKTKRVYNQTVCGSCKTSSVRMVKLGQDLSRVTFWCDRCQPLNIDPNMRRQAAAIARTTPKRFHDELELHPSKENLDQDSSRFKIHKHENQRQTNQSHQGLLLSSAIGRETICCPQHGSRTTRVKRVRHSSNLSNRNRLFGTCVIKGCPYFTWADTNFPSCKNCKSRTILRVSKTERSGGRWFFSCAAVGCGGGGGTSSYCSSNGSGRHNQQVNTKKGHFSWAQPNQLAHIQSFLTPLL